MKTLLQAWPFQWYGFSGIFNVKGSTTVIELSDFFAISPQPEDIHEIISYLKASEVIIAGPRVGVTCPFCLTSPSSGSFQFDGHWLWPSDLAHLVEDHDLILPEALYRRIRKQNYKPAKLGDVNLDELPWPEEVTLPHDGRI